MAQAIFIFIAICLMSWPLSQSQRPVWLVWNVGQGQWITHVQGNECYHFDMGGERAPWTRIKRWCKSRRNFLFISHWDWDHVSFIRAAQSLLPEFCVWPSEEPDAQAQKRNRFKGIRVCEKKIPFLYWEPLYFKDSNDSSRVAVWKGFLIPGDSSKSQEKLWLSALSIKETRHLFLGHHGSRSSTSEMLLRRLPNLKMSIVSARASRYGHPHSEVLNRLRRFHIPTLRTEDWGDLLLW